MRPSCSSHHTCSSIGDCLSPISVLISIRRHREIGSFAACNACSLYLSRCVRQQLSRVQKSIKHFFWCCCAYDRCDYSRAKVYVVVNSSFKSAIADYIRKQRAWPIIILARNSRAFSMDYGWLCADSKYWLDNSSTLTNCRSLAILINLRQDNVCLTYEKLLHLSLN